MRRTRAWTGPTGRVRDRSGPRAACPLTQANAAPAGRAAHDLARRRWTDDTREFDPDSREGLRGRPRRSPTHGHPERQADPGQPPRRSATPAPGSANDDINGAVYLKRYVLRGIGDNVQVWVANDRAFPTDDCRNDLGLTEVTQKQVNSFVDEFNTNMYPQESKVFSVPPAATAAQRGAAEDLGLPKTTGRCRAKQADDIVVLRRQRPGQQLLRPGHGPDGQTFIAGFFLELLQRAGRPQHHDDRRLRLAPPHGRNPPDDSSERRLRGLRRGARPADDQLRHLPPARLRGHLRPRVPAPPRVLRGRRRGELGQRRRLRLGADAHRLRRPAGRRRRDDADRHMSCFAGYLGRRLRWARELASPCGASRVAPRSCATTARPTLHGVPRQPLRPRGS